MALTSFPAGILVGGVTPSGAHRWLSERWSKVLYVHSGTGGDGNDGEDPDRPLASVGGSAGALYKAASSGYGTLIRCLRGHAENVTGADAWATLGSKTNVKIISDGDSSDRATFTWTTAATTCLFDTNGVAMANCNLNLEPGTGNVNVAAPITLSGNGCGIENCLIRAGTDANNKVTVGITMTGADCWLDDVFIHSADAAEATTFVRLTGATRPEMRRVRIYAATSATGTGVVQFLTTASTNVEMEDCFFINRKASSTVAVSGLASVSGQATRCRFGVLSDLAAALTGAWATVANMEFYDCRVTNLAGEAGATFGTVSA